MHRRHFLRNGVALSAIGCCLSQRTWGIPPDDPLMKNMGLQLYTVRNELGREPEATIEAVAKAGYRQVELMDVMQSEKIAELSKLNGLEMTSSFFDWRTIATPDAGDVASIDEVIEVGKRMGLKYLVFGYIGKDARKTLDDYRRIADAANEAADKISAAGMTMCYHNHSFEFEPHQDDKMGFDIFVERFDERLKFELDVFWVAIGGWSPVEMMERLRGRIAQLHLKDLKPGTETIYDEGQVPAIAFQEVGDGLVDFRAVLRAAREQQIEQCHVEQDQSPSPLDSIVQSHAYLNDLQL